MSRLFLTFLSNKIEKKNNQPIAIEESITQFNRTLPEILVLERIKPENKPMSKATKNEKRTLEKYKTILRRRTKTNRKTVGVFIVAEIKIVSVWKGIMPTVVKA